MKVPAHDGVRGNEWADWHATAALSDPGATAMHTPEPSHKYWVREGHGPDHTPIRNLGHALTRGPKFDPN
jgi:hypothetical protein